MTNMLIADFHIHSKYSRACSKNLTLPAIAAACETKGIDLVATSDFTHPAWMKHIDEELEECAPGILQLTGTRSKTKFILVTEISSIYSQGGKVRRVHSLIFSPSIAAAKQLIKILTEEGCNLKSDGRPIIGVSAKELLRICHEISPDMELVPAHAWTPWFSVFGSKSGFDSLEECFGELTPLVHAIETGLSSDPEMNHLVSALDNITLISNSDAHSLDKLGREATVLNIEANKKYSYHDILSAIRNKKIIDTIEFFPEEGKYHIDGHAVCKFSCDPDETKKLNGLCPVCHRQMTVGVLSRVKELSNRSS
ncbi:MAG: helicase UvrD, partial [Patescibacteria group bacterium]|nr:helicase UvrD [Patescibacteria group bacterium]